MERIVSKRDDFVVDSLFRFEPVQRFGVFGVLVTARAREFYNNWRLGNCVGGKFT